MISAIQLLVGNPAYGRVFKDRKPYIYGICHALYLVRLLLKLEGTRAKDTCSEQNAFRPPQGAMVRRHKYNQQPHTGLRGLGLFQK